MDFLILNPPVSAPSEPPSGAFVLASALCGHGYDAAFCDLSMAFYAQALSEGRHTPGFDGALRYLSRTTGGFDPDHHRSASGAIHNRLKQFSSRHNGWRLTAMDIEPPSHAHDPSGIARALAENGDPFDRVHEEVLAPLLDQHHPKTVVISLAYLSQLAGGISLASFLSRRGIVPVVGGSLLRSLSATGFGIDALRPVFPRIDLSNGASLIGLEDDRTFLDRLHYPQIPVETPWLTPRPIIPITLSIGCYWRKCLFCPDREMPFHPVPTEAIDRFLASVPAEVIARRPIIHLLDSAMPPGRLRQFLPLVKARNLQFYGFARPEKLLLKDHLIEDAAEAGCLMLQLGVESGSGELLDRFTKGVDPAESARVLNTAAAAGIRTYVYLLFGLPGETTQDRDATKQLLIGNASSVDFLNLSIFNLPRFCELADRAEDFQMQLGNYPGDDQMLYLYRPFTVNGTSPRDDARRFINEMQRHPQIRRACLQTPRWFRAAHLALFNLPGRRS